MLKRMRYMGIDFGIKRVGIALSDEGGVMAFPHSVIPNNEKLLGAIESLVAHEHVSVIVVGHSFKPDGTTNKIQESINEFIGDMTLRVGIPIHLEPEQYTTQEAKRIQGKNDMTDASAAAIILNSYFNRNK